MKKAPLLLLAAVLFAACGAPPANNTPANTNTNTAKAPAAPTADALMALDKAANEAYFKGDAKFFETFLSDKFGWSEKGKHMTKADVIKDVAALKCDMKEGWKLEDPQMSKIDDDTYAFSYKGTFDGSCTYEGKTEKQPSPVRGGTIFVRNGDKWQAAWHGETPLMEAKKDEKADAAKPADTKMANAAKPAEDKKEEPKKDDTAKPAAATKAAPVAGNAANTAADSAPAAEAKPDANTDALLKLETAGWMAWKDKDAKKLDELSAKNLAFIDGSGKWFGNRADVLRDWETTSGCTGVTKADIKNGFAWALSPTVEVLTFDATIDGMCGGQKNGPMHGMAVYIKEGDAWKVTFGFVRPAGKM